MAANGAARAALSPARSLACSHADEFARCHFPFFSSISSPTAAGRDTGREAATVAAVGKGLLLPAPGVGLAGYLSARERERESGAKNQVLITTPAAAAAMVKFACN